MGARRSMLVVTPWKRRWELGHGAGLADDVHFIAGLIAHGYDVHYVCPRDRDPPDVSSDGYRVHTFPNFYEATVRWPTPVKRVLWPLFFTVLASWRAWRVGLEVHPTVMLAQSYVAGPAAYFAARALGIPSVVKLFGVMDLADETLSRRQRLRRHLEMLVALRFPHDAWIVLDDGTRGDQALRDRGVPADRIHFLPNGVNLEWATATSDPEWLPERFGIMRYAHLVLYLARLVDWKRPDSFVRVAARVRAQTSRRVAFVVAGDGPERERCEALAKSLDLERDVYFVGAIPHAHIPDAMATADVFVATSRHSNRSIAVCEALVCGKPVAAFDTGQTHAVVRDGETGRLVQDGNEFALAAAIVEMLGDDEGRREMGRLARAFAQTHFIDWEERVEQEIRVLETLQRSRSPGA
jgi:glycosyltransferase involved in cell wall biosynthesis